MKNTPPVKDGWGILVNLRIEKLLGQEYAVSTKTMKCEGFLWVFFLLPSSPLTI